MKIPFNFIKNRTFTKFSAMKISVHCISQLILAVEVEAPFERKPKERDGEGHSLKQDEGDSVGGRRHHRDPMRHHPAGVAC